MMRSAVDAILRYNRGFPKWWLTSKLDKLLDTPFRFFRGTFHLFAWDQLHGPFRDWPRTSARGVIAGDLHTENFGAFRAITNEIVYDINDFDESTEQLYEFDLRRLLTSLLLDALTNGHRLGDGVNAAEICLRAYIQAVLRGARFRRRQDFALLGDAQEVRELLAGAGEKPRVDFLKQIAIEASPGDFAFRLHDRYPAADARERRLVEAGFPVFLQHVLAPKGARVRRYRLLDVARRIAGTGSLGRRRYALLVGKGREGGEVWETLRLLEWKESVDSGFDAPLEPRRGRNRHRQVYEAMHSLQLFPKRYLGIASFGRLGMQTREIGANDARFQPRQFKDMQRFHTAAHVFGEITARAHLLGSVGTAGPRNLLAQIAGAEDRFVNRMLAFASAYANVTLDDMAETARRRPEIEGAWSAAPRSGVY